MANQAEAHAPGAQPARGEGPFVFYSWLHGRPVVDAAGQVVGRLDDLAVNMADTFPPVTALVVRRGRLEPFPLTARWRDVAAIDGAVRLGVPVGRLVPGRALHSEHEHWVRSTLLDRQIVDTSGAKVVRVNDLHFLRAASGDLHLVHVDVGFRGLMRRLGWDAAIDAAVRRLSPRARYLTSERLISWRYVQPLALSGSGDALRLSLPRGELAELHPAELADVLSDLDGRERESVFRALAPEAAAEALTEVEPKIREQLIASVPPERAADILEEMPPDEAADLLAALPEQESELLLKKMERAEAREVAELLRYEPDTAGGMMTTELVALPADLTCAEALARLRARAAEVEFIYYLYVVDPAHRLRGVITIRQLLVAAPETPLEAIMERDIVSVRPDDTRERVAEVVEKYNLLAVPVLDEEEQLLGIVTVDDVLTHMTALAWKWKLGRKR
jgi:CBS domain-containing protein/sporulation protein YlmC with PRC-barrel domain